MTEYRGSRRHILDWIEQPAFPQELQALVSHVPITFPSEAQWLPVSRAKPREARLETFGPLALEGLIDWSALSSWWLASPKRGNTPNWDLVVPCELDGRPGLLLVEAKANWAELSPAGKTVGDAASGGSKANHDRIELAIAEASKGLSELGSPVSLSTTSHYQLANRLAFTWKLASLGLPVVLMYLGFTGDHGIRDAGNPFETAGDWDDCLQAYCKSSGVSSLFERKLKAGNTPFWVISRARSVLSQSPPKVPRQRLHILA